MSDSEETSSARPWRGSLRDGVVDNFRRGQHIIILIRSQRMIYDNDRRNAKNLIRYIESSPIKFGGSVAKNVNLR